MAQIKIYGVDAQLNAIKQKLSDLIHSCVVEALALPADKRFHRFFPLKAEDFYFPADRSAHYTIIEISMFEGRSVRAKKQLVTLLFARLREHLQLAAADVEITISETPRHNWGIRGRAADELSLHYTVNV